MNDYPTLDADFDVEKRLDKARNHIREHCLSQKPYTAEELENAPVSDSVAFSSLSASAFRRMREIMVQREEVLEAFIAKYGFEPERFVQCHKAGIDGKTEEWYVRRRTDEEMAELSLSASCH